MPRLPHIRRRFTLVLAFGAMAAPSVLPAQKDEVPRGRLVEGISCRLDPNQTYTVYLPTGYTNETVWPVLFVFDPRGRSTSAAEIFRAAAEEHGWIIMSSDNTRSDGPWEPNDRALRAMWPEPFERWSGDPRRLYAAGFSGGAIAALVLAEMTNGQLAGVIGTGGRTPDGVPITQSGYAHFGTAGTTDFNYSEMWKLDRFFADQGNPHRMETFGGRHQWLPKELAHRAIEWLEIISIRHGTRPRDGALIARLLSKELEDVRRLRSENRLVDARRRLETVVASYSGLTALDLVDEAIAELESDPDLDRQRREHKRWNRWEKTYFTRLSRANRQLLSGAEPVTTREAAAAFGLKDLRKRAKQTDYEGTVARRILERIWTNTSFYMARDLLAQERYREALTALSVAVQIRDDVPIVWYNLACAAARSGSRRQALDALERAVALGFTNVEHMMADKDLETLRQEPRFLEIMEAARQGARGLGSVG